MFSCPATAAVHNAISGRSAAAASNLPQTLNLTLFVPSEYLEIVISR